MNMNASNNKFDCIVIGGGLIGLLSAYFIARQGRRVALLEQASLGRESSWAGGGILSPLYPWRYPDAVTELVNWSRQHWGELITQLQRESDTDPQLINSGLLILDQEEQIEAVEWAKRFNVALQPVSAEQLKVLEPNLGPSPSQSLWMPDVGQVRNPRLISSLYQAALKVGVTVLENHPVKQFLIEQGQVMGVSSQQNFYAPQVVVAAGAWSSELLKTIDYHLEVAPVRGQMIQFQTPPGLIKRITLYRGRYIIPRRDGRVLAGSTLEHAGFDKSTNQQTKDELAAAAIEISPALAEHEVVHHWAGLRPGSPEGIPTIGELKTIKGLYINSGHFRNGVAISLASCRLLSDLITGVPPIINPRCYAP
ncbi:MAG: glycine oxidase ThiO [Gammaproteobacteria bacterium]|nr:glycine oxidase ThiO [Gammaproteobacteria bacterium]MCF6229849.1 glycine oxidase ThiO [Gammaproteobacteria bacterium]